MNSHTRRLGHSVALGSPTFTTAEVPPCPPDSSTTSESAYALLTATLVGVFVVLLVPLTHVLPFSSPVAVAASTLAAAALFNPLRVPTQRLIDRRFDRTRYDAEATVAAFGGRLRDAIDPDGIGAQLLHVVDKTVAPAYASVWIRPR